MNIESEIPRLLAKWQDILRLRDWDIALKIVTIPWRKSGDIKIDLEDKKSVLMINAKPKCGNLEELVVHELVHLKLFELDQLVEEQINLLFGSDVSDPKREFAMTQFMRILECTVEDLTKGYLAASRCPEPVSFGRIQQEVDRELDAGNGK